MPKSQVACPHDGGGRRGTISTHNADIAAAFDEIADILEFEEANPFRVRAYRNAARVIRDLTREVAAMVKDKEDLTALPGIGHDLAHQIAQMVEEGVAVRLEPFRAKMPAKLTALLKIPGLGPKKVKSLYEQLGIESVEQLADAAREGKIRALSGFGKRTEDRLLELIQAHVETARRFKLAIAAQYAEPLLHYVARVRGVQKAVIGGSYRRYQDTVGDIDILAAATAGSPVIAKFVSYPEVTEVLSEGAKRATVILQCGLQVDLRVVEPASFGAALQYFTGSKAHNIAVRALGQDAGLKINEYGVWRGNRKIAGDTEESVYATIGLPYIQPELRENRGELQAAAASRLPDLIQLADLKGDLHSHTKATDGRNSMKQMAQAAQELGLEYLAITDHSRKVTVAHGLDPERLLAQLKEIDRLNEELGNIVLLKGLEVDILEDGRLDMPDFILKQLDVVVCSVHSYFNLPRDQQTRRVLKAMDHPCFQIFAHPTGRLVQERQPYDIDMEKIIERARTRGCILELNSHPERLDLIDVHCKMAKDAGVLVAVNSDAHSVHDFNNLRFGIGQARRGWLGPANVLNTRPVKEVRSLLKAR